MDRVITLEEGKELYFNAPTPLLMFLANDKREQLNPPGKVTWIIDRNVNITNICLSGCKFCNFYRSKNNREAYITSLQEYKQKIDEMYRLGGRQLLLQGGMHPDLGLTYYKNLFQQLKSLYPDLKLHALGPPEIVHLAGLEKTGYKKILEELIHSGLDSLPGAGAEILHDEIREQISPAKAKTEEWLEVMETAHKLNLPTSATMMFGHLETPEQRIEHLVKIRGLQEKKPTGHHGFLSFIPWPFQSLNTLLQKKHGLNNKMSPEEYIRLIAISRIMLHNIQHVQASWLTVGIETAQICLLAGADDLGSIMIEENVVSSAGARHRMDTYGMQKAIREAGFEPVRRNQKFEPV